MIPPTEPNETGCSGCGHSEIPLEDALQERQVLVTSANGLGLTVLLYLFLRASLPAYIIRVFTLLLPDIRYFNAHLMAPDWVVQVIDGLCFLISAAIPFMLYMLFLRVPRRVAFPLRRPRISLVVVSVLISLAVSVLGSIASGLLAWVLRLFGLIPITPALNLPTGSGFLLAGLVNVCILPAILEEFVYRGVILQSLRRFGDGFAVVVSAAVFSLMHLNLTQSPTAFVMGLALGYFVLRTGSLWTGVIIHMVNNLIALFQQMAEAKLSVPAGELLSGVVAIVCLVLGFVALLMLARGTEDLFRLKQRPSAFTTGHKIQILLACPAVVIALVLTVSLSLRNIQMLP